MRTQRLRELHMLKRYCGGPSSLYDSKQSIRKGENNMNSKFWMVLSASLLTVLWTWGGNPSSVDASAARKENQSKAVIIQCVLENTSGDPAGAGPYIIRVFSSSSSAGAPVVQNGSECAQAIASVLAAGFELDNVAISPYGPQYTLIK